MLRIRLTDPLNAGNNARLVLAVQVDERGRISNLDQGSLQCGTGTT